MWDAELSIREVGPREGFQSHPKVIDTDTKVAVIRSLIRAGFDKLNAVSFVHPRVTPQMADAEAVLAALGPQPGVAVSALAPNGRGLDRAIEAARRGLISEVLFIQAMTRSVLAANGIDVPPSEFRAEVLAMAGRARAAGLRTVVFISAAFGCSIEGEVKREDVIAEAKRLADDPNVDELALSDSTGQATPPDVAAMFSDYRRHLDGMPLTVHFHDSRGAGLANLATLLQLGVPSLTVDASFGGLGGDVPFLPDAAGNVTSEDLVAMCDGAGIRTGISLQALLEATELAQQAYGTQRTFPSRMFALYRSRRGA